ncbi:MAG: hypothetical protein RMK84_05120 [Oscillochloridaceae bacterium]|nr:hypothetical protein [Chloroflexaceae bacterium]MDW8389484.1 hypothetical protein [Oscillochloridaceae bacterium]
MLTIDKVRAKEVLVTELNYHPVSAECFLQNYPPIHEELGKVVESWLEDRTIPDFSVNGLSIREIMQVQSCNFLVAVKYLNQLLDPELAPAERERLVAMLRRPFPLR